MIDIMDCFSPKHNSAIQFFYHNVFNCLLIAYDTMKHNQNNKSKAPASWIFMKRTNLQK